MASNHFIGSNRRHMVFPLSDTFTIENGLKNKVNDRGIIEIHKKICVPTVPCDYF